ncbi:hypothetical protein HLB23_22990 [Nocardia uniformis]|uniref:Uncharacterized protein n=1 Tax=Nocardia uniformis TaxID=53432 RepID=A0A849C1S5_9NOCA|nr:hypothetical protein [Nocardia uniformis]NNH72693.1 hypothetical protein [Nocardia uniformis]
MPAPLYAHRLALVLATLTGVLTLAAPAIASGDVIARKTLQFAPGSNSASVRDTVARGNEIAYRVEVANPRSMTVEVDGAASFTVFDPDGKLWARYVPSPFTTTVKPGVWEIQVGSQTQDVTYTLTVTIR